MIFTSSASPTYTSIVETLDAWHRHEYSSPKTHHGRYRIVALKEGPKTVAYVIEKRKNVIMAMIRGFTNLFSKRKKITLTASEIIKLTTGSPPIVALRNKILQHRELTPTEETLRITLNKALLAMATGIKKTHAKSAAAAISNILQDTFFEKDEVSRIQRVWRKSPLTLLKNKQIISSMKGRTFRQFIRRIGPHMKMLMANPRYRGLAVKALDTTAAIRLLRKAIPVFTAVGSSQAGLLPQYELQDYPKNCVEHQGMRLSPSTLQAFTNMEKKPLSSKAEVDAIVQKLYQIDLFPWDDAQSGCGERAESVLPFLMLMGVPKSHLAKQYVFAPLLTASDSEGNPIHWVFHVAPLIKLANGEEWVIDPSLDKHKALSVNDWIAKQNPLGPRVNLGRIAGHSFAIDPQSCVAFTTDPDYSYVTFATNVRALSIFALEQKTVFLNYLRNKHIEAETKLIRDLK